MKSCFPQKKTLSSLRYCLSWRYSEKSLRWTKYRTCKWRFWDWNPWQSWQCWPRAGRAVCPVAARPTPSGREYLSAIRLNQSAVESRVNLTSTIKSHHRMSFFYYGLDQDFFTEICFTFLGGRGSKFSKIDTSIVIRNRMDPHWFWSLDTDQNPGWQKWLAKS